MKQATLTDRYFKKYQLYYMEMLTFLI